MLFEGALCRPCDPDRHNRSGFCPNDHCPFHGRYQDEIVRWSPPSEGEEEYIEAVREKLRGDVIRES